MPCLQQRAYDSDPAVPTRTPNSSTASALTMNALSPDAEPPALAEAKGDLRPEAPIWAENITFHPRGPPSSVVVAHSLGPVAAQGRHVAAVENTPPPS